MCMKKIIGIIVVVVVIGVGWYLAKPLFVSEQVDEELPAAFKVTQEQKKIVLGELERKNESGRADQFEMPSEAEVAAMSDEEKEKMEIEMVEAFADEETVVEEPMEKIESPQIVAAGSFKDADNFHKGSGVAKLITSSFMSLLRFEDFEVTNGPDLRVLLSQHPDPQSSSDLGEYVELGKLKGNVGSQNYEIGGDVDLGKYKSVVIYCKPFQVVFSVASLE